jgi:dTDP-4-dehydrorhamnose 3,5-epimerase
MKIVKKLLNDVLILQIFSGSSRHSSEFSYDNTQLRALGITHNFVQENQSFSYKNVLRGLHFQELNPQGKLIQLLSGSIFDVFVDLRRSSPTFGHFGSYRLNSINKEFIWIPPGYAHGFLSLEESEVIYKVTEYRNPEKERTLLWNDKFINIEWPLINTEPIISEKDRDGKLWHDLNYYK